MREIKFRLWDGREITQINPVWFEEIGSYRDLDFSKCAKDVGCTLMQYTGLKDKNGKEIYEGDILRKNEICSVTVVEDLETFFTQINDYEWPYDYYNEEIVGNIYENQELLK